MAEAETRFYYENTSDFAEQIMAPSDWDLVDCDDPATCVRIDKVNVHSMSRLLVLNICFGILPNSPAGLPIGKRCRRTSTTLQTLALTARKEFVENASTTDKAQSTCGETLRQTKNARIAIACTFKQGPASLRTCGSKSCLTCYVPGSPRHRAHISQISIIRSDFPTRGCLCTRMLSFLACIVRKDYNMTRKLSCLTSTLLIRATRR